MREKYVFGTRVGCLSQEIETNFTPQKTKRKRISHDCIIFTVGRRA